MLFNYTLQAKNRTNSRDKTHEAVGTGHILSHYSKDTIRYMWLLVANTISQKVGCTLSGLHFEEIPSRYDDHSDLDSISPGHAKANIKQSADGQFHAMLNAPCFYMLIMLFLHDSSLRGPVVPGTSGKVGHEHTQAQI
jgi:hypothetical protein